LLTPSNPRIPPIIAPPNRSEIPPKIVGKAARKSRLRLGGEKKKKTEIAPTKTPELANALLSQQFSHPEAVLDL
jgi:hypothetical protein